MAEIKPAEISAILRKQVEGFESGATLEEVGTVLQVGDGIARIYGLSNVQYGELVEFDNGLESLLPKFINLHNMRSHLQILNTFGIDYINVLGGDLYLEQYVLGTHLVPDINPCRLSLLSSTGKQDPRMYLILAP